MFKIRLSGDLGHGPIGVLAGKEAAEAFAEFEFAASLAPFRGTGARKIEQQKFAFASSEKLDREFQLSAFGMSGADDAAREVTVIFPGLQQNMGRAGLERVVGWGEREDGFSWFEERGELGRGEKLFQLLENRGGGHALTH